MSTVEQRILDEQLKLVDNLLEKVKETARSQGAQEIFKKFFDAGLFNNPTMAIKILMEYSMGKIKSKNEDKKEEESSQSTS